MKTQQSIIFAALLLMPALLFSQGMNFKASKQRLVPVENFLPEADWKAIFFDQSQKDAASRVGIKKRVAIAPDESIFINDRYKYRIMKLDPQGRIVKTFGGKGSNPGEFINNPDLPARFANGWALNEDYDMSTWYSGGDGARGYTDRLPH